MLYPTAGFTKDEAPTEQAKQRHAGCRRLCLGGWQIDLTHLGSGDRCEVLSAAEMSRRSSFPRREGLSVREICLRSCSPMTTAYPVEPRSAGTLTHCCPGAMAVPRRRSLAATAADPRANRSLPPLRTQCSRQLRRNPAPGVGSVFRLSQRRCSRFRRPRRSRAPTSPDPHRIGGELVPL